jgi:hypothetical protein
MVQYLADRGLVLMSVEPEWSHGASGQLMRVDGVFFHQA